MGALVSPASPKITTVSTLDPIKVYFTVAEQEYLDFHRRYSTPATLDAERKLLKMELILADGSVYPHNGNFYFTDRQVDVRTGAITVAGLFPNPGNNFAARPIREDPHVGPNAPGRAAGPARIAPSRKPAGRISGRGGGRR